MLRRCLFQRQVGGGSGSSFPIITLPAQSLWCRQQAVRLSEIGDTPFTRMAAQLRNARSYYQYPCLTAPQIGWNVQVFTLYDGSVWINPEITKTYSDPTCWTWEVSASAAFMLYYIERPYRIVGSGYNEKGQWVTEEMTGMRSRLFQHSMDFMKGELFQRRIPDASHVVPMDGFYTMSEWDADYPSLEARSTNLYTTFIPPTTFQPEYVPDSQLLERKYTDGIYPGHDVMEQILRDEKQYSAQADEHIAALKQRREKDEQDLKQP